MSLSTTVILDGAVQRLSERSGTAAATGKPYRIRQAIIVGPLTMGEVTLPDDMVLAQGQQVQLVCEVSTFRDDDQLRAVLLINPPKAN